MQYISYISLNQTVCQKYIQLQSVVAAVSNWLLKKLVFSIWLLIAAARF